MINESDTAFKQRLRDILAKSEDVAVPPLTPARLTALRALIPESMSESSDSDPFLTLAWQRIAGTAGEALVILKAVGVSIASEAAPLVRNGGGDEVRMDVLTYQLLNGELKAQMLPLGWCKAKLMLSVKGECSKMNDLAVELSQDGRLVEARPLEQKTEVTLDGVGQFVVTLLAGSTVIGAMRLNIGIAKDSGNG